MRRNHYWLTLESGEESSFLRDPYMKEQYQMDEGVLPVRYYDKHFYFVDWHWHEEVEFTVIQCDELICEIGSERLTLKRGDCLLINSQVMHRYAPTDSAQDDSLWDSLLFDPKLIFDVDSTVYQQFIEPILRSSRQYLVFDRTVSWQNELVELLKKAQTFCISNPPEVDLYLKHTLTGLWILLVEHRDLFPSYENASPKQQRMKRLRGMMRYIWEHYPEPITLADIAREVHVSERTAERCFKNEIQVSPLIYLLNYRLACARRMLLSEEDSILNIALSCGFENISYFDRVFKRTYHMTPNQFRKSNAKQKQS